MSLIPSVFDPFWLDVWDPFAASSSSSSSFPGSDALAGGAHMDWKEMPEAHVFKADLPGMNKDHVKIEVEDGRVLQISGERKRENEQKNERWHRLERSYGKFTRRFRLPDNANTDEIKAAMENGVLRVTVPKKSELKPEIKHIQISG